MVGSVQERINFNFGGGRVDRRSTRITFFFLFFCLCRPPKCRAKILHNAARNQSKYLLLYFLLVVVGRFKIIQSFRFSSRDRCGNFNFKTLLRPPARRTFFKLVCILFMAICGPSDVIFLVSRHRGRYEKEKNKRRHRRWNRN